MISIGLIQRGFGVICLLLGLLSVQIVQGQTDDGALVTDDDVNRVASQLYCPTCESVPVDVCPTEVCSDWRNEIRSQLATGRSDDEILDYFAVRYGNGVLANPPAEGFGLLIWIVPTLVVLGGAVWFVRYLGRLQSVNGVLVAQTFDHKLDRKPKIEENTYRQRLEEELNL